MEKEKYLHREGNQIEEISIRRKKIENIILKTTGQKVKKFILKIDMY